MKLRQNIHNGEILRISNTFRGKYFAYLKKEMEIIFNYILVDLIFFERRDTWRKN